MIAFTIDSADIDRLALRFDQITPALQEKLKVVISRVTNELLARVKAAEPSRTGRLRGATAAYVDVRPNFVRGRVRINRGRGAEVMGARFGALEYGGPGRRGGAVAVRAYHRAGVAVAAYDRRRPRIAARRFLRGPAAAMRPLIREQLLQVIKEFESSLVK